jgi:hypothetical protein
MQEDVLNMYDRLVFASKFESFLATKVPSARLCCICLLSCEHHPHARDSLLR